MRPLHKASSSLVRGTAGFTLLELLVVLVIFSLIMAALVSGARFANQALHIEERSTERSDDFASIENFLRPLLQTGTKFKGTSDSLSFVGRLPAVLAGANPSDIKIKLSDDRLVLAWRPHIPSPASQNAATKPQQDEATVEPEMTETELSRGIEELSFSYFFPGAGGQPGGWKDLSPGNGPPPDLIRVSVSVSPGDVGRRRWIPLIIAPKIGLGAEAKK